MEDVEERNTSGHDWRAGFQRFIYRFYDQRGRDFIWRRDTSPYIVFLSEFMLQQTQTSRVEQKLPEFLRVFPDFASLAAARLSQVLSLWQGMGYNRRAGYLHRSAQEVVQRYHGFLPEDPQLLRSLPGIGSYTSNSIPAFAYNRPTVFIETNIRRVYLHHFFHGQQGVADGDLMPLIAETLDTLNPRRWYYALMDYGAYLSRIVINPNRRSRQYTKQSPFEGSVRQVRGAILRILTTQGQGVSRDEVYTRVYQDLGLGDSPPRDYETRFLQASSSLINDGLILQDGDGTYNIP